MKKALAVRNPPGLVWYRHEGHNMCHRIGTIARVQNGKLTAIKMTCRSWSCPSCQKDRAKGLVAEVMQGKPERFITLTVNPNWFDSPEERARRLVAAWRLIRRRFLKMHPNAKCEFIAIFERHKSGEPHLHIAQRGAYIRQKWLSQQMEELMGAKIVDISYIRKSSQIAMYVAKYVGKEPFQFGTLKRYWRSIKYLEMSKAAAKRIRNAGAWFYIMDCHWKPFMRQCQRVLGGDAIHLLKRGFECAWPQEEPPPWCLTIDPIICGE